VKLTTVEIENEWSYTSTPPRMSSWLAEGQFLVLMSCILLLEDGPSAQF